MSGLAGNTSNVLSGNMSSMSTNASDAGFGWTLLSLRMEDVSAAFAATTLSFNITEGTLCKLSRDDCCSGSGTCDASRVRRAELWLAVCFAHEYPFLQ